MIKKRLSRYIDMLSDFGWKLYFGEQNKENLINFLNSLLEGEHIVKDLVYSNVEEDGELPSERKIIFDLRCVGMKGEVFLVEMQLQSQDFFFDRAVSYTSRTISKLVKRGRAGNSYELPPVYFVAVLGFCLDPENRTKYYYSGKIMDEFDNELLYPKLSYKLLALPNFHKSQTELRTVLDQWMYLMKHLDEFDELPKYLDKRIFSRIFEIGELAKLTPEEKMSYISSLEQKRIYEATVAYAEKQGLKQGLKQGIEKGIEKGIKKGIEQGKREEAIAIALEFKKMGLPVADIAKGTGLSMEEIEKLK